MRLRRRSSGGAASTHIDVGAVLSTHVDVGSRAFTSKRDVDSCMRGLRCVSHLGPRMQLRCVSYLGPRMQLRCVSYLGPPLDVGLEMGDSIGRRTVGQSPFGG